MDQSTSVISLRSTVDREQQDTYHLTLIASDGGGTLANPNRAITLVVVTVQDINDNPPVFSVSGYQFSLVEGTTYTNFLTVTVQNLNTYNVILLILIDCSIPQLKYKLLYNYTY